ncbi:hypothetical protein FRX31_023482 [Thalictrum thalictroides]|uniref:Uncharacterized protein n=1 Tax=Thalictrum thalictroides TaxID=46969 RepID=A0A7J6VRR4_THATH|nr:hypothetical protein FRX31_023482 [Thalictrum thalictroides]
MIRPDNRTAFNFNLISRTQIHLPPLPDATQHCQGTFDSIPTRFDNKTVIMANTTENGADVTKFFMHKDRSDQWAIENQGRRRIDGPLLYRDKLIWIRNGNCVEIINENGQLHQFEIAELDMPKIVKIVLEPNAFAINQYEIITTIAPFDILLIPEKEASYVYNPVEDGDGKCLFFGSDFNRHLSTYVIAGGAIVERAREFFCESCLCQAAFYGVS